MEIAWALNRIFTVYIFVTQAFQKFLPALCLFKNQILFEIILFLAKPIATHIKDLRLKRDDFDTLNIIGRGAFGEVFIYLAQIWEL